MCTEKITNGLTAEIAEAAPLDSQNLITEQDRLSPRLGVYPFARIGAVRRNGEASDVMEIGTLGRGMGSSGADHIGVLLDQDIGDSTIQNTFKPGVTLDAQQLHVIQIPEEVHDPIDIWLIDGEDVSPKQTLHDQHKAIVYADEGDLDTNTIDGVFTFEELFEGLAHVQSVNTLTEPYQNAWPSTQAGASKKQPLLYTFIGHRLLIFGSDVDGSLQMSESQYALFARRTNEAYQKVVDPNLHDQPVNPDEEGWARKWIRGLTEVKGIVRYPKKTSIPMSNFRGKKRDDIKAYFASLIPREPDEMVQPIQTPEIKNTTHEITLVNRLPTEPWDNSQAPYYIDPDRKICQIWESDGEGVEIPGGKTVRQLCVLEKRRFVLQSDGYIVDGNNSYLRTPMQIEIEKIFANGPDLILQGQKNGLYNVFGVAPRGSGPISLRDLDRGVSVKPAGQDVLVFQSGSNTTFRRYEKKSADSVSLSREINDGIEGEFHKSKPIYGGLTAITWKKDDTFRLDFFNPSTLHSPKSIDMQEAGMIPVCALNGKRMCLVVTHKSPNLQNGFVVTFDFDELQRDPAFTRRFGLDNLPGQQRTYFKDNDAVREAFKTAVSTPAQVYAHKSGFRILLGRCVLELA